MAQSRLTASPGPVAVGGPAVHAPTGGGEEVARDGLPKTGGTALVHGLPGTWGGATITAGGPGRGNDRGTKLGTVFTDKHAINGTFAS